MVRLICALPSLRYPFLKLTAVDYKTIFNSFCFVSIHQSEKRGSYASEEAGLRYVSCSGGYFCRTHHGGKDRVLVSFRKFLFKFLPLLHIILNLKPPGRVGVRGEYYL